MAITIDNHNITPYTDDTATSHITPSLIDSSLVGNINGLTLLEGARVQHNLSDAAIFSRTMDDMNVISNCIVNDQENDRIINRIYGRIAKIDEDLQSSKKELVKEIHSLKMDIEILKNQVKLLMEI